MLRCCYLKISFVYLVENIQPKDRFFLPQRICIGIGDSFVLDGDLVRKILWCNDLQFNLNTSVFKNPNYTVIRVFNLD